MTCLQHNSIQMLNLKVKYSPIKTVMFCIVAKTMNFPMFKVVLEKAEEPEIKLPTSAGSSKKAREFQKNIYSALLTLPKPLTVWITINCGKF